jgi:hypothetical protein
VFLSTIDFYLLFYVKGALGEQRVGGFAEGGGNRGHVLG